MAAPDQAAQLREIAQKTEQQTKLKQIARLVQKEQSGKLLSAREQRILDDFKGSAPGSGAVSGDPAGNLKGRGGRLESIRWTIEKAAGEFDINPRTLVKNLKSASIEPGADAKFSTSQICQAIFGDLRGDLTRAQTRNLDKDFEIKVTKHHELLKQLAPIEFAARIWNSTLADLRNKILNSGLSSQEKEDICADLQNVPVEEYFSALAAEEESEED